MFEGEKIYLRQIEENDSNVLILWENDVDNWRYSETEAPYSRQEIIEYVKSASQVRQNNQLRFMICLNETDEAVGAIDLFNIDFKHLRGGVGILIAKKENRGKGYALEALTLLERITSTQIELHQLFCEIISDNDASIHLFEKAGFIRTGIKKDWHLYKGKGIDVYFYQKII